MAVYFVDKVLKHFFCDRKIGDDPILKRTDRRYVSWCAPKHRLSRCSHRHDAFLTSGTVFANSNYRRLIKHNALTFYENQSIGCAEVD